jgi:hypothetical protein
MPVLPLAPNHAVLRRAGLIAIDQYLVHVASFVTLGHTDPGEHGILGG